MKSSLTIGDLSIGTVSNKCDDSGANSVSTASSGTDQYVSQLLGVQDENLIPIKALNSLPFKLKYGNLLKGLGLPGSLANINRNRGKLKWNHEYAQHMAASVIVNEIVSKCKNTFADDHSVVNIPVREYLVLKIKASGNDLHQTLVNETLAGVHCEDQKARLVQFAMDTNKSMLPKEGYLDQAKEMSTYINPVTRSLSELVYRDPNVPDVTPFRAKSVYPHGSHL